MTTKNTLFLTAIMSIGSTMIFAQNALPVTGNVGIGTISPACQLEVRGNTDLDGKVVMRDTVKVEGELIIEQNVIIKGTTSADGQFFLNNEVHMPQLRDTSALQENKLLYVKSDGTIESMEKGGLGSLIQYEAYGTQCKFDGPGQPITSYWKSIPTVNHGVLSTGVGCPAYVGIGTETPQFSLDVRGTTQSIGIRLKDNSGVTYLKNVSSGTKNCLVLQGDFTSLNFSDANTSGTHDNGIWGIEYNPGARGLNFWRPDIGGGNYALFLNNSGNVGIGTSKTPYKLSVNGSIGARLVKVELDVWADYVFEEDYKMLTIEELAEYVRVNKHLPNVPTEKDVLENGIDLGQTDAILLEKIEELALYIIQLKKENEEMKGQLQKIINN